MIRRLLASFLLSGFALATLSAQAEGPMETSTKETAPGEAQAFSLRADLDGGLLVLGLGLGGAALVAEASQERKSPGPGPGPGSLDPTGVNPMDRRLMAPYSRPLDRLGTGLTLASILTPGILLLGPREEWGELGAMYGETLLLAYGMKELGKALISRPRPGMYFPGYPQESIEDGEWDESFPSGHVALAFAGATYAAYVLAARFPGSRILGPAIATGYALALGTAACRVASGDHFLTDVLAGAGIGSLCGFLVPWLHSLDAQARKAGTRAQGLTLETQGLGLALTVRY